MWNPCENGEIFHPCLHSKSLKRVSLSHAEHLHLDQSCGRSLTATCGGRCCAAGAHICDWPPAWVPHPLLAYRSILLGRLRAPGPLHSLFPLPHPDNLRDALFTSSSLLTWPSHLNWNHHTSHSDIPNSFYLFEVFPLSTYHLWKIMYLLRILYILTWDDKPHKGRCLFWSVTCFPHWPHCPVHSSHSASASWLNELMRTEICLPTSVFRSGLGASVSECNSSLWSDWNGTYFICWQPLQEKVGLSSRLQTFSECPLCGWLWGAVTQPSD